MRDSAKVTPEIRQDMYARFKQLPAQAVEAMTADGHRKNNVYVEGSKFLGMPFVEGVLHAVRLNEI